MAAGRGLPLERGYMPLCCRQRPGGGALWACENGCPWPAYTRDRAAAELGYTDDLGNLVDE